MSEPVPRLEADLLLDRLRARGWTLEAIAVELGTTRLYRGSRSIWPEGLHALRALQWRRDPQGATAVQVGWVDPCTPEVPETPAELHHRHQAWIQVARAGLVSAIEAARARDAGRRYVEAI